jgi:flagellin
MVQDINKGAQAQGSFLVTGTAISIMTNQTYLTINGQIFGFSTGTASSYTFSGSTGTIALSASDAATAVVQKIARYFNSHAASIGVYGAVNGATLQMVAYEFGEEGNAIGIASNQAALLLASGSNLENGGRKVVTASAYYDADNEEWELQLQMNQGGEANQVQTFGFSSATAVPTSKIMGGYISGVAFTASNKWMADLRASASGGVPAVTDGTLTTYSRVDEQNEWIQPQNGVGRTDWDGADVLTQSNAQKALAALDEAITKKDIARANLGAIQNRLENTITNLQIQAENLQAAESRISDVDVATEMTEFTKTNLMAQAAVAMLAQANSLPQLALSLIGG